MPEGINIDNIFHYTKLETALEKILPQKRLMLSQLKDTNDPRETKKWEIKHRSNGNKNTDEIAIKVTDELIPKTMREEWKILCFTLENSIPDYIKDEFKRLERQLYHGYARPRMWAQYAQKHQGVCFWFDGNKLNENIYRELGKSSQIFQGKIRYDTFAPSAFMISPILKEINILDIENDARNYVIDNHEYFFLRKHLDWEAEAEYRWLIFNEKHEHEFVSIVGAIKEVLISIDFPEKNLPLLIKLCENLNIPISKVNWRNGQPISELESIYKPTV